MKSYSEMTAQEKLEYLDQIKNSLGIEILHDEEITNDDNATKIVKEYIKKNG